MVGYLTQRIIRLPDGTTPVMGVKKGDVAEMVLLAGNPARVELMREQLQNPKRTSSERGYIAYTGTYKDTEITVACSGMGGPSISMVLEELADSGGTTFIRVGSCASIQEEINIGDALVVTGAVRDEGTSNFYAPPIYPAIASHKVVAALCDSADASGLFYHLGPIRTTDSFYEGERNTEIINLWRQKNILAFEQETSTLFVVCAVRECRSGAILVPGANLVQGRTTFMNHDVDLFRSGTENIILIALDALVRLSGKPGCS